ncbi:MlaD family protein [Xylophilus sp. GW821-FHT01B05]
MENKSHAFAAGLFVLVVTGLLVLLAFWLTRDSGSYKTYELSTKDTVTGLQLQAPVRYKGVPVGKVTQIGFDREAAGNVLVRIAVEDGTPLTPTTFGTLAYQGITGLAFILLDDDGQALPAPPAGSDGVPRLPVKPSQLGKLTESAPAILAQVEEAGRRLNTLLSDENQQRFSSTLSGLSLASNNIARLTSHLDSTLTDRVDPVLAGMPRVMGDAGVTLRSLQAAAQNVSSAATEIGTAAGRLNEKDGPLDRLAQGTGALSHTVDQFGATTLPRLNRVGDDASRAVRQLGRTVTNINDNPQSLLFGNGAARPGPGEPGFAAPGGTR